MELVAALPNVSCPEPDGAFYIFPSIEHYLGKSYNGSKIETAEDLCMYLLNEAHVSTVTGAAFGAPGCVRISFANAMEKIEEGFNRITRALAQLQ